LGEKRGRERVGRMRESHKKLGDRESSKILRIERVERRRKLGHKVERQREKRDGKRWGGKRRGEQRDRESRDTEGVER